jgi:hypothetical protein
LRPEVYSPLTSHADIASSLVSRASELQLTIFSANSRSRWKLVMPASTNIGFTLSARALSRAALSICAEQSRPNTS